MPERGSLGLVVGWWKVGVAAVATTLFLPQPAIATSCNEDQIAAMSVDEAAEMIWTHSDVIGLGYVSTVDTPEREQQFIDLLVALKGAAGRYDYAPLRVGRLGSIGPGLYRLDAGKDQIVLVTLVRTGRGYVTPACRMELLLAKGEGPILRRLAVMSGERR